MLIAVLMVLSVAAVLFTSSENGPERPKLPQDVDMMLTYEATGSYGDLSVNGSFQVSLRVSGYSSSTMHPFNVTGEMHDLAFLPGPPINFESLIDDAVLNTSWGEKFVNRFISPVTDLDEDSGICIAYRGAHTGLAYRFDLLASDLKVTYNLVASNVNGFNELDREYEMPPTWMNENQVLLDDHLVMMNGGGTWALRQLEAGDSASVTCTLRNYTLILFDEDCIKNMMEGGDYQYRADWSVLGNGTVESVIEQGRFFYMLFQNSPSASAELNLVLVEGS